MMVPGCQVDPLKNKSLMVILMTFLLTSCMVNISAAEVKTAVAPYFSTFTLPAPVDMGPANTPFSPILPETEIPAMDLTIPGNGQTNPPTNPSSETMTPTNKVTGTITQVISQVTGTSTNTPTSTLTMEFFITTGTVTGNLTWILALTRTSTPTRTMTRTPTSILSSTMTSTPTLTRTSGPPTATINSTLVVPTGPVAPMQLIEAVNQLRAANGFPPLIVDSILMDTAQWTAETMAVNHYMNHLVYLGYPGVRDRIAAAGYGPCATVWATENWAMGFPTLAAIMVAWSDAAHMLPMTQAYYKDIGAGVATGPWGTYYIVHAAYTTGTVCNPTSTKTQTPTSTSTATLQPTLTSTPTSTATPTLTSNNPAACTATANEGYESQLIDLINAERTNQGFSALTYNSLLTSAAKSHSLDMACQNYFSHTGSDGSSPFDRISWTGYSYQAAAENIFAGSGSYNTPQQAFDSWMSSSGHRDNMINPDYTEIGIGCAGNSSGAYEDYFTAVFAKP